VKFVTRLTSHQAREIVNQSTGLEQTRALAQEYVDKAIEAISFFPDSEAKTGLVSQCCGYFFTMPSCTSLRTGLLFASSVVCFPPKGSTILTDKYSADLEMTVNMLIQIDKLVQLLESPVFTCKPLLFEMHRNVLLTILSRPPHATPRA